MVTHLQDHHCSEALLAAAAKRRKEGGFHFVSVFFVYTPLTFAVSLHFEFSNIVPLLFF